MAKIFYVIVLNLLLFSSHSFSQTCTGENGACHPSRKTGEYLVAGSQEHNYLYVEGIASPSLSTFYNNLDVPQQIGTIGGRDQVLTKNIANLLSCSFYIHSGLIRCQLAGPMPSQRENLFSGKPAKVSSRVAKTIKRFGSQIAIIQEGLEYFCEENECYIQINLHLAALNSFIARKQERRVRELN